MRIRHKALRRFYLTSEHKGLPGAMVGRLAERLSVLAAAGPPDDLNLPGYRLHALKGDLAGWWNIRVTGNWRLICRFEAGEAVDVDLVDYH